MALQVKSIVRDAHELGQMTFIVVLGITVVLTVGLAVASRVITNLKISKENEESQRAFQAAEAGIQVALENELGTVNGDFTTAGSFFNATYQTRVIENSAATVQLNGGTFVTQTKGIDVYLAEFRTDANGRIQFRNGTRYNGNVDIYWGTNGPGCGSGPSRNPALEVLVIEPAASGQQMRRFVYDPCGAIPNASGVLGGGGAVPGGPYQNRARINIDRGYLMKLIPIYNSTRIAVSGLSGALPAQGRVIESVGRSGPAGQQLERKIVYYSSYPQLPPELFYYSILSQGHLQ